MSRPAEEKRKTARVPYVRTVRYMAIGQSRYASSGILVRGKILNIGNKGVQILTEVRHSWEETVFRAWIPLPDPPITVPVLAQVQWIRQKRCAVYVIGLQFVL